MSKTIEISQCPHGWTDCELCVNIDACRAGTYIPEPDPEPELTVEPEIVNELEENELANDLGKEIPRDSWAGKFSKLSYNGRMNEFYKYHADDLISKEPIPLDGEPAYGGGSKSKRPKKPKWKMPEYLKLFGQ